MRARKRTRGLRFAKPNPSAPEAAVAARLPWRCAVAALALCRGCPGAVPRAPRLCRSREPAPAPARLGRPTRAGGHGAAVRRYLRGCKCYNVKLLLFFFFFFFIPSSKPANQSDGGRSEALYSLCDLRGVTRSPLSIILN